MSAVMYIAFGGLFYSEIILDLQLHNKFVGFILF